MEVFVTGGTRVLGRPVVRLLIERGHQVRALARTTEASETLRALGAEPVRADLFDRASLGLAVGQADAVLHLATRIPPSSQIRRRSAWDENDRIRREGTRGLVDAALAGRVGVFVYPGVALAYPDSGDTWIDAVSTQPSPVAILDSSLDAEAEVARFAASARRGVSLRMGAFYGPESPQTQELIAYARRGFAVVLGRDDAYQSSIWVQDAARAVVAAMERSPSGVYDVVDDEPLHRAELVTLVAGAVGRTHLFRVPGFVAKLTVGSTALGILGRSQRVANRRFKETTDWEATVPSARLGWAMLGGRAPVLAMAADKEAS